MVKKWTTFKRLGYTFDAANDQRSAGGVECVPVQEGAWWFLGVQNLPVKRQIRCILQCREDFQ